MQNQLKTTAFILLYFLSSHLFSQVSSSDIINGTSYTLTSEVLKENRKIQVYLPESYSSSDKNYPVVYILDGQRLFDLGVSMNKSFKRFRLSPDFIVVGIVNTYPQRFGHFSSKAEEFIDFIQQDVISFIDRKFRTSKDRLLFGWEYAGGFAIQTLISNPDLFTAYIAASPFPLNAPDLSIKDKRLQQLDSLLHQKGALNKHLYFSVAEDEGMVKKGTNDLNALLLKTQKEHFKWKYRILKGEEHRSTAYATLYKALKSYFYYYPVLQFSNHDAFLKAGGVPYVKEYYQKRAQQYGFSSEIPRWTRFSIIRNAMRANNYVYFTSHMKEFSSKEFLSELRVSRAASIAEFYLTHKNYQAALDIFKHLLQKNTNSRRILKGLADTYLALQDHKKHTFYLQEIEKLPSN